MKYPIIFRLLGILILLESVAMLLCGLSCFLIEQEGEQNTSLFTSAGITAIVGLSCVFLLGEKPEKLPKREGLILVGLAWIVFGVFGAIPFVIGEPSLSFTDAVFESISGFTTTGATVIEDLTVWPKSLLLWRATTQWLGGLGILVLFMALLSTLGADSKFLFKNESSFQASEISTVKIRDIALKLLQLYLIMTVACMLGLKCFGMTWFESVTHSFPTVSTAGFSIYNESVGFFADWETAWLIEIWLTLFMVAASFSFVFYLVLWKGNYKKALEKEEVFIYLLVLLFGFLNILFAEFPYIEDGNYLRWIRRSLFMTASLSTTTGYGLIPERDWPVFIIPALSIIMMIGGCSGSTAGGIKVSRIIIFWRVLIQALIKAFRPNKYVSIKVNGRPMKPEAVELIILFVALFLVILIFSTYIVAVLENHNGIDLQAAFGAVVACISSIGPGFGEVGIWGNYAHMHDTTKYFLSFLMILGRLELFTLLALFTPATWRRF